MSWARVLGVEQLEAHNKQEGQSKKETGKGKNKRKKLKRKQVNKNLLVCSGFPCLSIKISIFWEIP